MKVRHAALYLLTFSLSCKTIDDSSSSVKVVNGRPALETEHTETVLLAMKDNDAFTFCSGVALSHNTVLTAAHCVLNNIQPGEIKAYQTDRIKDEMKGEDKTILGHQSKHVIFPDSLKPFLDKSKEEIFKSMRTVSKSDVAIVLFEDGALTGTFPKLAKKKPSHSSAATIVGFGDSEYNPYTRKTYDSGVKRIGALNRVNFQSSTAVSSILIFDFKGAYQEDFVGPAPGDSGGPLFLKEGDDDVVVGIWSGWLNSKTGYNAIFATTYSDAAEEILKGASEIGADFSYQE